MNLLRNVWLWIKGAAWWVWYGPITPQVAPQAAPPVESIPELREVSAPIISRATFGAGPSGPQKHGIAKHVAGSSSAVFGHRIVR